MPDKEASRIVAAVLAHDRILGDEVAAIILERDRLRRELDFYHITEKGQLREEKAELVSALTRMMVGLTKESTPNCDWYESIEWDAVEEARPLIDKGGG